MREYTLPNAAAHNITVTATATLLEDLINTAGGSPSNLPNDLDAVMITAEDGDIRYLADGNIPTASAGNLITAGQEAHLEGVIVKKMRLIRVGGSNAACSVRVGRSVK